MIDEAALETQPVRTGDARTAPVPPGTANTVPRIETGTARPSGAEEAAPAALAERLCEGFLRHDRRDRSGALEAFFEVDRHQFAHLDDDGAWAAAEAFVAALWAKDEVERAHSESPGSATSPETFDEEGLATADWGAVTRHLTRRARIVGMSDEYATATTESWRRHKTGGDYWTPTLLAQAIEVRAATGNDDQLEKPRHGRSGHGHLPARYLVGLELHDMRTETHWEQAVAVMTPYFAEILAAHGGGR